MSHQTGLTYLVCDKCCGKTINGSRKNVDGWGRIQTFGNDGSPGVVMASWDICPACLDSFLELIPKDPTEPQ